MNGLNHNALTCSAVPIPPWERPLQTVEAQPYFNVSQASLVLEGIVFDRNNNLLFVDVATGRVFKLTPERQLSIVLKENSFGASGLAVHKDGRIFIASVGDMQRGSVRAIEPNGTREQMIVAPDTGFLVNDLVFDNQGGFYFTDSRGNSADPQGGVFYVSPNVGSIHAILPGLAVGNGIAIDPAGSQIWATEHAKNRLHRVRLSDATTVAPFGSVVTYQFTGPAPDGARVDSEGNVYVAISGQGRVMVFNRNGLPIGQIVLPDRDKGRNLKSTSLAIRPGHRELFIVANSGTEPGGAMIFRSGAFAPAPFVFVRPVTPQKAMPGLAIMVSAPAVIAVGLYCIYGGMNDVIEFMAWTALFFAIMLISLWRRMIPDTFGRIWWGFTFPSTALASALIRVDAASMTTLNHTLALAALTFATFVVCSIIVMTVRQSLLTLCWGRHAKHSG